MRFSVVSQTKSNVHIFFVIPESQQNIKIKEVDQCACKDFLEASAIHSNSMITLISQKTFSKNHYLLVQRDSQHVQVKESLYVANSRPESGMDSK